MLVAVIFNGGTRAGDLQVDVRDGAGQSLTDMLVYAEPLIGTPAPRASAAPHVIIDQVYKEFVPRVSVVQTGTQVDFPNSDNIPRPSWRR